MYVPFVRRKLPVLIETYILAHITREWPFPGMYTSNVHLQLGVALVNLVAVTTLVRMDAFVGQLMELSSGICPESLVTLVTFVRLFPGVNLPMVNEVSLRFEATRAYFAFIWPFVRMRHKMNVQIGLSEEAFLAVWCSTFELFRSRVQETVRLQSTAGME